MLLQQVCDAPVAGHHEPLEVAGRDHGAGVEGHVLPAGAEVDLHLGGGPFDGAEHYPGDGLHDLLDECGVVVDHHGGALEAHPIAPPAVEAADADAEGIVAVGVLLLQDLPCVRVGKAAGVVGVEPRLELPLPFVAALEEEVEEAGNGVLPGGVNLASGAVLVADEEILPGVVEHLPFEAGREALVDGHPAAGCEAEVEVGFGEGVNLPGEALLVPQGEGVVPVAELLIRHVVDDLEVHGSQPAFAVGHPGVSRSKDGSWRRVSMRGQSTSSRAPVRSSSTGRMPAARAPSTSRS